MGYEPYSCKRTEPEQDDETQAAMDSMRAEMQRILQMPMRDFIAYSNEIQERLESTDLLMEQGTIQL